MSVQRARPTPGPAALVVLSLLALADACTCGKSPIVTTNQCVGVSGLQSGKNDSCGDSTECGDHFECKDIKDKTGVKCCVFVDRPCATEADCCEGQTCPADRKKCFDKSISCTKDADCGDRGDRFCETYTDTYGSSNRCRFHVCGTLGECPEGQACFQGECMADLPCNGTCAAGSACVPSIDRCQDYSSPTGRDQAACPMTCAPGFIGTFKDPRNLWDSCDLPSVKCVCAELPGLRSNDLGRFSAIGADPGKNLWVSAYDGQYGDLVAMKFGLDGKRTAIEYVDGVPQAAVKYGPSGARGGIVEPGPDVGRYTDVVVTADERVLISYYDVTNGDLKLAVRGTDGKWATQTVDGATGNVGLYTSLALDPAGNPAISYFQLGGDTGFDVSKCPPSSVQGAVKYVTALKYAHAKTPTPASASDWVVTTVACMDRPPPPCDACGSDICVDPGSGPACFTAATTCTTCDPNTQACVSVNGTATCAKKSSPTPLADVPVGIGLFSSLAFKGDQAVIAFTRRSAPAAAKTAPKADLMGVTVSAQNAPGPLLVLDGTGDTGYFPDVKVEPGTGSVGIGYHDFTSKAFKFYYAPALQTGVTPEIVDTGVDPAAAGNLSFVGTDSAVVFTGGGKALAVYMDATKGDLKLARRAAAWTVDTSVATVGAVGFFADAVLTDGKVYASHARLRAQMVQGEPQVANTLQVELVTP